MKILKILGVFILVVIITGVALYFISSDYSVSRSTEINVPASHVYGIVADNRQRGEWSPWEQIDPDMEKEFEGPETGAGSIVKWSSASEEVGTGSLTINEVTENEYIKSTIAFTAPWESSSTVEWKFEENNGVTTATWSNSGAMPMMMSMMVDMDEMLGESFEKGLASLKAYAEGNYEEPVEEPVVDTTMVDEEVMIEEEAAE